MAENIVIANNIINDISNELTKYLEVKDLVFENEFVESLGDAFKVINLLKTGHDLVSKIRLKAFLNGFSYDDNPTEKQLLKLHKYIDSETKASFIADMFSKVLLSNSKLACMVMGIMVNDLISSDIDINHSKLICANALVSFFDDDVTNYHHIFQCMHKLNRRSKGFYDGYVLNQYCKNNNLDYDSVNLTLYKSISYQLFLTRYEVDVDVDIDPRFGTSTDVDPSTYISITKAGELLYTYIEKISPNFK